MQKRKIPTSQLPGIIWTDKNKEFYYTHANHIRRGCGLAGMKDYLSFAVFQY